MPNIPVDPGGVVRRPAGLRPFVALLLGATVAVLLAASGSEAGAQTGGTGEYTVTDLGVLPEGLHSEAHALNGSGQVVGGSSDADSGEVAFLYENGGMEDLGTLPGGSYSSAEGIDGSGRVVGWSDTPDNRYRAFLWQKDPATGEGTMTGLGTLLDGTGNSETPYAESQAHDINDAGQVVGSRCVRAGGEEGCRGRAVVHENGQGKDLNGGS